MQIQESNKAVEKKIVKSAVDQWMQVNNQVRFYKIAGAIGGGIGGLLLCVVLFQSLRAPLVVYDDGAHKVPYMAATKEFKIDEEQIRRFVTEYLYLYHRWDKLDPEQILKQIGPFTTEGLNEKVKALLNQRRIAILKVERSVRISRTLRSRSLRKRLLRATTKFFMSARFP
jgi:hypothetical protein